RALALPPCSIAPQHLEQGARDLRLGALGPKSPCRWPPTENVEMRKSARLLHEPAQKQRGRDRAGKGDLRDVAEIGEGAVEGGLIAAPERQSPDGIADAETGRGDAGRQRIIVGVERGQIRSERDAGGACQGGEACHQLWSLLVPQRQ